MQELKKLVYKVMLASFNETRPDVRPEPRQVAKMLDLLWDHGPTAGQQDDKVTLLVEGERGRGMKERESQRESERERDY